MTLEKRPMTASYTIPKHWKRWAFSRGYTVDRIIIMCDQFKNHYSKTELELTDLAWERRFHKWVENQKGSRYLNDPVVQEPKPEGKSSPFIALQYLAQMKMILANSSNKLNHS